MTRLLSTHLGGGAGHERGAACIRQCGSNGAKTLQCVTNHRNQEASKAVVERKHTGTVCCMLQMHVSHMLSKRHSIMHRMLTKQHTTSR